MSAGLCAAGLRAAAGLVGHGLKTACITKAGHCNLLCDLGKYVVDNFFGMEMNHATYATKKIPKQF